MRSRRWYGALLGAVRTVGMSSDEQTEPLRDHDGLLGATALEQPIAAGCDKQWAGVHWRANNAAMKAAVAKHPNAKFLDYAAYAQQAKIPYMNDGSHPTPKGMGIRAHWIVSQLG